MDRSITAHFSVGYDHAIKIDSQGNISDPRQNTCVSLTANACSFGSDKCFVQYSSCIIRKPYDPTHGWVPVGLISGSPTFDEKGLRGAGGLSIHIYDENSRQVGIATLTCQYRGTYQ
jgi:hypothetical protein